MIYGCFLTILFFFAFFAVFGGLGRVKEYNAKWKFFGNFYKNMGNFKQVKTTGLREFLCVWKIISKN